MAHPNAWSPGTLARMPWLPVAGFIVSILGLVASTAILVYSNGKPIADWPFQPPTYLAIATVITNICLFYVLKEGANISWWHTATKSTTIGDLHRNYLFGSSFQDAILSGKNINFVALTCIIATVAQINSPLLQRASRAVVEPLLTQTSVQLRLINTVPDKYFTGYVSGRGYDASLYSADFANVVADFNNNVSVPALASGCKGSCSATVEGLGFALNCSSYSLPFDLNPQVLSNGSLALGEGTSVDGFDVFESRFRWSVNVPSNFSIGVAYKPTLDCSGDLIVSNCSLRTAKVRYPVIVDGNASTIALDPHTDIFSDEVLERYILTAPALTGANIFSGIWLGLQNKFSSSGHLRFVGAVGYEFTSSGNLATQYAVVNGSRSESNTAIGSSCDVYFRDPMAELLAGARNLMFRLSVAAANETTPLQTLTAVDTQQRAVFRTQYAYMGGALALTLVALVMAAALFKGYAELGRSMTMSPIEVAKAFDAPILKGSDSNARVKTLIKQTGKRSVKYGASNDGSTGSGFGPTQYYEVAGDHVHPMSVPGNDAAVKEPFVNSSDSFESSAHTSGSKLHMGSSDNIRSPRKGEVFSG
ncbi:MAG: DUF3176 domain-containing protein [Terriglobus roseus]|nr:DUF3176 domain-containing protein [Terriglobus roseus]